MHAPGKEKEVVQLREARNRSTEEDGKSGSSRFGAIVVFMLMTQFSLKQMQTKFHVSLLWSQHTVDRWGQLAPMSWDLAAQNKTYTMREIFSTTPIDAQIGVGIMVSTSFSSSFFGNGLRIINPT